MAFYHMQMQQENIDTGQYQVTVSDRLNNRPIENARVRISYTGAPDSTIEEVATDSSGRTPVIELKAPPLEYSMEPVEQQPYSEYTIQIEAEGFEPKRNRRKPGISRYFIQAANNAECHGIRRNFPENCNSSAYVVL